MDKSLNQKLIVCIIKKGFAKKIIKSAKADGLEGATLITGEGTIDVGRFESLLGLSYNPDKDIILSVVSKELVDTVVDIFVNIGKLKEKNTGILLVIELNQCEGIAHLLKEVLS